MACTRRLFGDVVCGQEKHISLIDLKVWYLSQTSCFNNITSNFKQTLICLYQDFAQPNDVFLL